MAALYYAIRSPLYCTNFQFVGYMTRKTTELTMNVLIYGNILTYFVLEVDPTADGLIYYLTCDIHFSLILQ